MGDLVARTGRHQQRYEDGYRLVAGCVPYRYTLADDTCNGNTKQRLEVLMITSQSGPRLVFPKGGWENDETVVEAARREALEEAGVRGEIKGGKSGCVEGKNRRNLSTFQIYIFCAHIQGSKQTSGLPIKKCSPQLPRENNIQPLGGMAMRAQHSS